MINSVHTNGAVPLGSLTFKYEEPVMNLTFKNFAMNSDGLTDAQRDYLLLYGFKQSLQDAGAVDKTKYPDTEERKAESNRRMAARFAQFESGEVPSGTRENDPVGVETRAIGRAKIIDQLVTQHGLKKKDIESKQVTALYNKYFPEHGAAWRTEAEAVVAARDAAKSTIELKIEL